MVKSGRSRAHAAAAAAAAAQAKAGSGGGGKKKGKQVAAPKVEQQQPKALLQQHCQRCGWAALRFERLPHGGMRLEAGGYRYAAVVDTSAAAAKGPKRRQAAAVAGPRTFSLREAEDGWERIEDAQNAAATRALFELAAGGDAALAEASPPLWAQLPPAFQELWLLWQEEGEEADEGSEGEAAEEAAAREAFVRELLERAEAEQAAFAAAASQQQQQAEADVSEPGGWQEQLLRSISAAGGSEEQRQQHVAAQRRDSERLAAEQRAWRASEEGRRWLADRAK